MRVFNEMKEGDIYEATNQYGHVRVKVINHLTNFTTFRGEVISSTNSMFEVGDICGNLICASFVKINKEPMYKDKKQERERVSGCLAIILVVVILTIFCCSEVRAQTYVVDKMPREIAKAKEPKISIHMPDTATIKISYIQVYKPIFKNSKIVAFGVWVFLSAAEDRDDTKYWLFVWYNRVSPENIKTFLSNQQIEMSPGNRLTDYANRNSEFFRGDKGQLKIMRNSPYDYEGYLGSGETLTENTK